LVWTLVSVAKLLWQIPADFSALAVGASCWHQQSVRYAAGFSGLAGSKDSLKTSKINN
jgi:hypothetical protein